MSELTSGIYFIKSKKTGDYVGRGPHEDMSLLPKSIILLPKGIEAPTVMLLAVHVCRC